MHSKFEARVKELRQKFMELRSAFMAERIIHVEISVLRVLDGVDRLKIKLDNHSILMLLVFLRYSHSSQSSRNGLNTCSDPEMHDLTGRKDAFLLPGSPYSKRYLNGYLRAPPRRVYSCSMVCQARERRLLPILLRKSSLTAGDWAHRTVLVEMIEETVTPNICSAPLPLKWLI
jgi:hypothetical protein